MVKNLTGGSGHKKNKNSTYKEENKNTDLRDKSANQVYGVINKVYGNGKLQVTFINDISYEQPKKETKLGIVRGSNKRGRYKYNLIRVNIGDVILISLREYEKDKVDVLYKYNDYDKNVLRKGKHINDHLLEICGTIGTSGKFKNNNGDIPNESDNYDAEFYDDDEDNEYIDDDSNKKKLRNNISYNDIYKNMKIESSDDESYVDDI